MAATAEITELDVDLVMSEIECYLDVVAFFREQRCMPTWAEEEVEARGSRSLP